MARPKRCNGGRPVSRRVVVGPRRGKAVELSCILGDPPAGSWVAPYLVTGHWSAGWWSEGKPWCTDVQVYRFDYRTGGFEAVGVDEVPAELRGEFRAIREAQRRAFARQIKMGEYRV